MAAGAAEVLWSRREDRAVFEALFPTPKSRKLELLGPDEVSQPNWRSRRSPIDPTSDQKSEQLPTYNAYSRDGDVTAPLVYVNYGAPADYEQLAAMGVSVKGAIVIARYGQTWRGIKPKLAAEHGAVGCLIYSDPQGRRILRAARSIPRARCGRRMACSAAA